MLVLALVQVQVQVQVQGLDLGRGLVLVRRQVVAMGMELRVARPSRTQPKQLHPQLGGVC